MKLGESTRSSSTASHLYTWGDQQFMQCGHGSANTDNLELPARVKFFGRMSVKHIAAGQYHSLALTEDNELYSWGLGRYGRLGQGHTDIKGEPQKVIFSMAALD